MRRTLILGYGLLFGLLLIPLGMRALDAAGLRFTAFNMLLITTPLIGAMAGAALRWRTPFSSTPRISAAYRQLSYWQKFLIICLLGLIVTRLLGIWLEVSWRPLFPWDAYMHWATKTRVWTHTQSITPFVPYQQWLEAGGAGVYTDRHPGYPITIPLLQTWMNIVVGRWDDTLMNLPWAALLPAAGAAFFAQARLAGAGPLAAMAFCYMFLSLPMVNLHAALAGYADLYLGAFYLASLMAFYNWSRTREPWQAVLALTFALACPLIKNEGLFWMLTLVPAVAAVLLPRRWFFWLAGALLTSAALLLALFPKELSVAGHTLAGLELRWRGEVIAPLAHSLFVFDNWHLLFWAVIMLVIVRLARSFFLATPWPTSLFAVAIALSSASLLYLFLFFMTDFGDSVPLHTSEGRIALHLAPSLTYFALLIYLDIADRRSVIDTGFERESC